MPPTFADLEASFTLLLGVFRSRQGGAHAAGRYSNKKLCFVATDKEYLVAVLFDLSRRDDCFAVKYTIEPRDGMHLGRAFFVDEAVVGSAWAHFKDDPKLLCSVQDDDFTLRFRSAGAAR